MLNRLNLTDSEVVKDFAFELRRCVTNEDYAAWAKKWGELTATRLLDGDLTDHEGCASAEELEEAESAASNAEANVEDLQATIRKAVDRLETIAEPLSGDLQDNIYAVATQLEEAL
jgi:hypothetical protein